MVSACVINRETALTRMGGDEDLLAQLAEFFLVDAPMLMRELDEAVRADKLAEASYAAHTLKGLAANFEALAAVSAARDIEVLKHTGSLQGCEPLVETLHVEMGRLMAALRTMLQSRPNNPANDSLGE